MPYEYEGRKFFKHFDGIKYFINKRNNQDEENLKKQYVKFMTESQDIDRDFKNYIKNLDNVKLTCIWGYAADIKFPTIWLRCKYTEKFAYSYNERAKIEENNITFHSDTGYAEHEDYHLSTHEDYLTYSPVYYIENKKEKSISRSSFNFSKMEKIDEVPSFINKKNFDTDSFIYSTMQTLPEDLEMDARIACYDFCKKANITSITIDDCRVNEMSVYFVPIYKIYVEYEGCKYSTQYVMSNHKNEFSIDNGKKSAERLEKERKEREEGSMQYNFETVKLYFLTFEVHFIFWCLFTCKRTSNFFGIPIWLYIISLVASWVIIYAIGNAILKKITYDTPRKFLRIQHIIFHIFYLIFLIFCYCGPLFISGDWGGFALSPLTFLLLVPLFWIKEVCQA